MGVLRRVEAVPAGFDHLIMNGMQLRIASRSRFWQRQCFSEFKRRESPQKAPPGFGRLAGLWSGNVGGDAPGIVAGEQFGRRAPTGVILEID